MKKRTLPKILSNTDISLHLQQILERFGFDPETFEHLQQELQQGRFPPEKNHHQGSLSPLKNNDVVPWQAIEAQKEHYKAIGHELLASDRVALVILNGGMATRFGGVVKGTVEIEPGRSFLAHHIQHTQRLSPNTPIFLLNSFATHELTNSHLNKYKFWGLDPSRVGMLSQSVSLRLRPDGALFVDPTGQPSPYAPGHGDLFDSLVQAPSFQEFIQQQGRHVVVVNVDNIGALLSPILIGAHEHFGQGVSVEVCKRQQNDQGGAPLRVQDKVEIVEGFRFPPHFDKNDLTHFNTNTLILSKDAIKTHPLTWFRANKEIAGQSVVQFERLMGEVTSFEDSTFIEVPRCGPESRFRPVKTREDLAQLRTLRSQ
jgi:UTP--glucose-1-phosphate uridylyltransferase